MSIGEEGLYVLALNLGEPGCPNRPAIRAAILEEGRGGGLPVLAPGVIPPSYLRMPTVRRPITWQVGSIVQHTAARIEDHS